jgi:hypothetical protein
MVKTTYILLCLVWHKAINKYSPFCLPIPMLRKLNFSFGEIIGATFMLLQQVKRPAGINATQYSRMRSAVENLIKDLPESWTRALDLPPRVSRERPNDDPKDWQIQTYTTQKVYTHSFARLSFKEAYKLYRAERLELVDFSERALRPLVAYRRMTGRQNTSPTRL